MAANIAQNGVGKTYCQQITHDRMIDLLRNYFRLQFPDFGYDFVKIFQHIRRICFKIFTSSRQKSENFATKIIAQ